MLKTLDILIGAVMVLLLFSMAVTVITQAVTSILGRRGKHLKAGLADLLQQLGISNTKFAEQISQAVLTHPLLSEGKAWWGWGKRRLGTIVSREDFTKILLDAAASFRPTDVTAAKDSSAAAPATSPDPLWSDLDDLAKKDLVKMLQANGISDPAGTLKNVRAMTMKLEAANPTLATNVRHSLALMHEAASDYVARVNAWYDQTMDRVSERFTKYTHYVTIATAALVVLTVQLDMIAVVDRLSVDDRFRDTIVQSAIADVGTQSAAAPANPATQKVETPPSSRSTEPQTTSMQLQPTQTTSPQTQPAATPQMTNNAESPAPAATTPSPATEKAIAPTPQPNPGSSVAQTAPAGDAENIPKLEANKYYNQLSGAGLITLPLGYNWVAQFNWRKVPGMLIAILLISLGAPFWYNILKDLIGLRSSLAKKDEAQRQIRQTNQDVKPAVTAIAEIASAAPQWLRGERGDLGVMG